MLTKVTTLRSVLAVLAGYGVIAGGVITTFAVIGAVDANAFTSTPWVAFILVCDALFMLTGGYVAGRLAPHRPLRHALVLGAMMTVLGAMMLAGQPGGEPLWYQLARLGSTLPAVCFGGRLAGQARCADRRPAHA